MKKPIDPNLGGLGDEVLLSLEDENSLPSAPAEKAAKDSEFTVTEVSTKKAEEKALSAAQELSDSTQELLFSTNPMAICMFLTAITSSEQVTILQMILLSSLLSLILLLS